MSAGSAAEPGCRRAAAELLWPVLFAIAALAIAFAAVSIYSLMRGSGGPGHPFIDSLAAAVAGRGHAGSPRTTLNETSGAFDPR